MPLLRGKCVGCKLHAAIACKTRWKLAGCHFCVQNALEVSWMPRWRAKHVGSELDAAFACKMRWK